MTNGADQRWAKARGKFRIRTIRGGKWWRERGQKSLSMIPHLFTLLNLACGVVSIMLTMRGRFDWAALMIAGSLIADGLDGRLARMLKADGEFGKQMDSLADVVAFGTAPAILLYEMAMHRLGYYGIAITILFPMCGALRLARFNIIKTSGFFLGVPITAAGTFLSSLAFYVLQSGAPEPDLALFGAVVLCLSFLMISSIPYPDFKKRSHKGALNPWPFIGPILVVVLLLVASDWNPWMVVLLPLSVYISVGPWLLIVKQWNERVQPWLAGTGRR